MGDVLPLAAIHELDHETPDPRELRTANLRRFAECLDTVIQRHAAEMTPNDRREADAALRGLVSALDEADRVATLGRRSDPQ